MAERPKYARGKPRAAIVAGENEPHATEVFGIVVFSGELATLLVPASAFGSPGVGGAAGGVETEGLGAVG